MNELQKKYLESIGIEKGDWAFESSPDSIEDWDWKDYSEWLESRIAELEKQVKEVKKERDSQGRVSLKLTEELNWRLKDNDEKVAKINRLEKQVEGMRCSGNCENMNDGHAPCNGNWRFQSLCPCAFWKHDRPKEG